MDSESIWEQIQTRSRPLLRSLESEIAILNQTLKSVNSNEIHHDLNGSKDINHQQEEELSSFESEEDQLEFQSTQSSQSDGDEPIRNVEDDMEEFLDEVDQVEEKRLAEIDDPYSATKVFTLSYI